MNTVLKKPSKLLSSSASQAKQAASTVTATISKILESLDDMSDCYEKLSKTDQPINSIQNKQFIGSIVDTGKVSTESTDYDDLQDLLIDLDTELDDEFSVLSYNLQTLQSIYSSLSAIRDQITLKSLN